MQKTAYEMRISDWSSDVCSSDLRTGELRLLLGEVNALANDKLPDNLMAASDVVAQTRTALVEAQCDNTQNDQTDRKTVVKGKSVSVRVDSGGGRINKNNTRQYCAVDVHNKEHQKKQNKQK